MKERAVGACGSPMRFASASVQTSPPAMRFADARFGMSVSGTSAIAVPVICVVHADDWLAPDRRSALLQDRGHLGFAARSLAPGLARPQAGWSEQRGRQRQPPSPYLKTRARERPSACPPTLGPIPAPLRWH